MTYTELKAEENQYVMNTYGRFAIALDHGEGSTLWDVEGKRYIDLTSGIGVCCLGYNNETIVNAITEQAHKLMHVSNLFTTAPMVSVAKALCTRTGLSKVFFANSGAEANEGMIKLARKYSYDKYGEGRAEIVTLNNSFHGRTMATITATGQEHYHKFFTPFVGGFDYCDANDSAQLEKLADENTCAIMMEMIQGEGGVLNLDEDFVKAAERICREKDILFIVDEVQTGIGRSGKLFAHEHFGVKPDIVTFAKGIGGGLPIGGAIFSEKCCDVLKPGDHGTTYGGNPVACAGAVEVLTRMDDAFLREVEAKGEYIKEKLMAMPQVKGVSGMGLMLGVAVEGKEASKVVSDALEAGLMILTAKDKVRLLPPLTITYEEIDAGLAILEKVLA